MRHHHVRPGRVADHARLARLLSGRAIGLALSGGGARGFVHIGVLRALQEAGVPVDVVAGTSMGAMIGAVHALGYAPDVVLDRCRAWTLERPWTDFTLPLASIVRGRRLRRALEHRLGDGRIEDLWLPYACMTSNLTRATADAHTEGPLVRLVLASNSVPGLAPPVFVSLTRAFTLASDERAQAACRDADLTLRPPLGRHAAGDFSHIDAIAEIGFAHAREHVAGWAVARE